MKSKTIDGTKQVEDFLRELKHPLKKEIEEVRKIILKANKDLTEQIKWNAPSFCHNGDDRITFNFSGKEFFRLVFHCGAKVKASKSKEKLIEDTTGLLDWASNDRAIAKFTDMKDVKSKNHSLTVTIQAWVSAAGK
jgi:hypothetical protein